MFDPVAYLNKEFPYITEKDVEQVLPLMGTPKELAAGDFFIKEGEVRPRFALILNGLFHTYILDKDGNERTVLFQNEGGVISSHKPLFLGQPSTETVQAIEDSIIVPVDIIAFKKLAESHINLSRAYAYLTEKSLLEAIQRIEHFVSKNREDHYKVFQKEYPDIANRVPLKLLASYLGIAPGSLSRIRKRNPDKE